MRERKKIIKKITIIATNLSTNHLGREKIKILLVNLTKAGKSLNEFALNLMTENLAGSSPRS